MAPAVVPNAGQAAAPVRFEARAGDATLFFTAEEVVLAQPPAVLRLRFDGADPSPAIAAIDRRPGHVNVIRGTDAARWRTGLPTYAGVRYAGLYPGVDVRHDTETGASAPWVRSTYTVSAGADAGQIRWRYAGAETVHAERATGGLRVVPAAAGARVIEVAPPVAWQLADGQRMPVDVGYRVDADGSVGFSFGRYDRTQPLIIGTAPTARAAQGSTPRLRYSSFLGGTRWDEMFDVDVNSAGDAYVVGITQSPNFPVTASHSPEAADVMDVAVTRVSKAGTVIFSTFIGGGNTDAGHNIAVDSGGNAYLTGRTESEDFPTKSPLQRPINGRRCQGSPCHDAFVTKLDPRGGVVYSTYLGGTENEEGVGIAVDSGGRAYVSGNTDSIDFPVRNAAQGVNRGKPCEGDLPCPFETFAAKLTSSGTGLHWSTYLGGQASDRSSGIAVDRWGDAYVTGTTRSTNFPTRNAMQSKINGNHCGPPFGFPCLDVFLTKLHHEGQIVYSTYFGGSRPEQGGGVAVDRNGQPHIVGMTQSRDLPTAWPIQKEIDNRSCTEDEDGPKELCDDGFVTGFSHDGRKLNYSTYFGGDAQDNILGIAVDSTGAIHLAGSTDSYGFRTRNALQPRKSRAIDAFVARLAPGGRSLLFSTFVGGTKSERFNGIAADREGASLVTGRTTSADFPTVNPFQRALAGDIDAVVARLK